LSEELLTDDFQRNDFVACGSFWNVTNAASNVSYQVALMDMVNGDEPLMVSFHAYEPLKWFRSMHMVVHHGVTVLQACTCYFHVYRDKTTMGKSRCTPCVMILIHNVSTHISSVHTPEQIPPYDDGVI
jgi:hypothetical protein